MSPYFELMKSEFYVYILQYNVAFNINIFNIIDDLKKFF